jgi:hypothetical protein
MISLIRYNSNIKIKSRSKSLITLIKSSLLTSSSSYSTTTQAFNTVAEDDGYAAYTGYKSRYKNDGFNNFVDKITFAEKKPGTLILVRHGESEWNAQSRFTGWVDVDLSQRGIYLSISLSIYLSI